MRGDNFQRARELWKRIADCRIAEGDLTGLLLSLWKKWARGSLAAELARALLEEAQSPEADPEPEPISLAAVEHLPTTQRVDGIMPLTIPRPTDARWPADELIEEAVRLRIGLPPDKLERGREELALAFLALLHRRPLISDHRLAVLPMVACPGGAMNSGRETLMLLAALPLGGRITAFYSAMPAVRHCAFPAAGTEYFDRFVLKRSGAGTLQLAAGPARSARAREKWTFRL